MMDSFTDIIIASDRMKALFGRAEKVAQNSESVLIMGETGTGKEIVARYIHAHSNQKELPFIPLNCAALPDPLIESELFGHKKGSFTDARSDKLGLLESAHGGTVFLDEIGELPLAMQSKLLRALETKEILPVGSVEFRKVDFRLISASNRDLAKEQRDGKFRSDLFYRISTFLIHIPPLRERLSEIPLFIEKFVREKKKTVKLSPQVLEVLLCYPWPGNIRELRNVLIQTIEFADKEIQIEHLPKWIHAQCQDINILSGDNLKEKVACFENCLIKHYIKGGTEDLNRLAKQLGISLSTLYRRIKEDDST